MAAYVIAELLDVIDGVGFEEYRQRVPATVEKYGGRFIARRGTLEVLDGQWQPKGLVKALRLRTARTNLVLLDGL